MYFWVHRSLWQPLISRLVPLFTLSVVVVSAMFTLTYVPQAAILAIFNGPLAVLTTFVLVMSESSAIITILSKTFLLEEALVDTFDGVRNALSVALSKDSMLIYPV